MNLPPIATCFCQASEFGLERDLTLLLFTATYPYDVGAEQTFLDVEVRYLQKNFQRIILVPRKCQGNLLSLPEGVEVEPSYAALFDGFSLFTAFWKAIFSSFLYQEVAALPWLLRYPVAFQRLLAFLVGAFLTRNWIEKWILYNQVDAANCLCYTYWFDQAAYGLGLAKQTYPSLKLVSRVHGYDLYEEYYYHPPYWPRRRATLSLLDRLFPDSQAGFHYLNSRYPEFSSIYELALLGVQDPGFQTRVSTDGIYRIVSCSMLEPVKRVELLLEGIASAARGRPEQRFEWRHFGNGDRRLELQNRANEIFPPNAKGFLSGYSTKEDLMRFYKENPVDVFVNVSATEGTPVAVMEAISCGIPVIATAVGGNAEIVSEKNGLLLDADPSADQISNTLLAFLDDHNLALSKRQGSRKVWQESYNADVNFRAFAERLKAISES
jgi:glycosyltransferase involved in cell wall biosynthesis